MGLVKEFKEFALKGNVLDLAVGVVIGAAFGKIVKGMTDNVIMPLVSLFMPTGDWRAWGLTLRTRPPEGVEGDARILLGDLLGVTIDFIIVAAVLFLIVKGINRLEGPAPAPPAPATRECPACLEQVPLKATRCRACTSDLPAPA
jgi:large conductance mechanosensitive channel